MFVSHFFPKKFLFYFIFLILFFLFLFLSFLFLIFVVLAIGGLISEGTNLKSSERVLIIMKSATLSHRPKKGISVILPDFLYLGSIKDAGDKLLLEEMKITNLVNCTKEGLKKKHKQTQTNNTNTNKSNFKFSGTLRNLGSINHVQLDLLDVNHEDTLLQKLDIAISFIEKARAKQERVLVFCMVGKSRSPSIVCFFNLEKEIKRCTKFTFFFFTFF